VLSENTQLKDNPMLPILTSHSKVDPK